MKISSIYTPLLKLFFIFLSILLPSRQAKAQDWLRIGGNELIDIEVYKELDVTQPPYVKQLPDMVDLSIYFPVPSSQGGQPSCAAWASVYALMSYTQYGDTAISFSDKSYVFSPAYIYNNASRPKCSSGMSIYEALTKLQDVGGVSLVDFPYDSLSCELSTESQELELKAYSRRISGFSRVELTPSTLRAFLAKGHPLVISLRSDSNLRSFKGTAPFNLPIVEGERQSEDDGNHAVVLVGYDISKDTFRILNSWGIDWGDQGYADLTAASFLERLERAYIVQPYPKKSQEIILPNVKGKPLKTLSLQDTPLLLPIETKSKKKVTFHAQCSDVWVSSSPSVQVLYTNNEAHALHISLEGSQDNFLVVQGPNGRWICDGQAHQGQAWTVFPAAVNGTYKIWIGSRKKNIDIATLLTVDIAPPKPVTYVDEARNRTLVFTKEFSDGSQYSGEWRNYQFHGQGSFVFSNGDSYVGSWKEGKKHGQGTFQFQNGDIYRGDWKEGNRHGQGIYQFQNGNRYEGSWKEGDRHGQGVFRFSDGGRYTGEWNMGKKHGLGIFQYADGSFYEGEWSAGEKNGQGIYQFRDGDRYSGDWKADQRDGQGTYYFQNGDSYAGGWKEGKKHGQGVYQFANGTIHSEVWKNGQQIQ